MGGVPGGVFVHVEFVRGVLDLLDMLAGRGGAGRRRPQTGSAVWFTACAGSGMSASGIGHVWVLWCSD